MKLQLFISLLQRDKKKFLARNKFSNQTNPLPIIPIAKKKKNTIYKLHLNLLHLLQLHLSYKTETENKKEDRYLPLIIPAGIIGNRFCNFDKLFAGNRGMGKVRSISKFLCKERIVEHRYHGAHLSNYAIRASRRRREKRGEAKKRDACRVRTALENIAATISVLRVYSTPVGRPASICLRSSYEISTGRAYTQTLLPTVQRALIILLSPLCSFHLAPSPLFFLLRAKLVPDRERCSSVERPFPVDDHGIGCVVSSTVFLFFLFLQHSFLEHL